MNVLEINDSGLLLSDGTQIIAESPGYAALDGRQLLVGSAARARSRLDPRRTYNRYWYQLDAELPAPMGPARSHADLAHTQLQSLAALTPPETPLLLAVPGSFTREQLGVLLGLVEASGLRAQGLVDAAVAAASALESDPRCLHLDVELHRFVLTVLDGGEQVSRLRVQEVAKPGLSAVWEALARVATSAFVQQTRFDPMHTAGTEQLMFDALPAWLELLSSAPTTVLELSSASGGGRTHRAGLSREDLVKSLREPFEDIASAINSHARPRPATLLLSARAAAVPGLAEHLERATGLAPARLDALAPARGARAQHECIAVPGGAGLAYVTRLAGRPRSATSPDENAGPTHLLVGDRALPLPLRDEDPALPLARLLSSASGSLRRLDGKLWLDGMEHSNIGSILLINGRPARAPLRLGLGDRIEFEGLVLRLIEVAQ